MKSFVSAGMLPCYAAVPSLQERRQAAFCPSTITIHQSRSALQSALWCNALFLLPRCHASLCLCAVFQLRVCRQCKMHAFDSEAEPALVKRQWEETDTGEGSEEWCRKL